MSAADLPKCKKCGGKAEVKSVRYKEIHIGKPSQISYMPTGPYWYVCCTNCGDDTCREHFPETARKLWYKKQDVDPYEEIERLRKHILNTEREVGI